MPYRFLPAAIISLLVVGVLGMAPVPAQDDLDSARAQREEIRREAAQVAAEIDLLEAEDVDVAQALVDLDAFIAQTNADIDGALQAIVQAEADAEAADLEVLRLDSEIGAAREVVRELAVSAYVAPVNSDLDFMLSADDPREGELRQFFVEVAGGSADEAVGELRRLQDDQDLLRSQADEARVTADASRAELETKRAELEEAKAAQEEVSASIQQRISEWEGESAALAAADAEVTALIQAEEARIRAAREAEAARQAELERQRQLEAQRLEADRLAEEQRQVELQNQPEAETDDTTGDPEADTDGDTAPDVALPPATAPTSFIWPINGAVTSPFGFRIHPIFGTQRFHSGLDINGSSGQPIAAAASGVVISSSWMDGYGNAVIIDHGGGLTTLYAHQSQRAVSTGQSVAQGETIGYVGSTGWSTGPHLHFEARISGSPTDPLAYL